MSDNNGLDAAAERVERLLSGVSLWDVYANTPTDYNADVAKLIAATRTYLALAKPDSREGPVTGEWLESIGWTRMGNTWFCPAKKPNVYYVDVDQSVYIAGVDDWKIESPSGPQVLALLDGMGVNRKGQ